MKTQIHKRVLSRQVFSRATEFPGPQRCRKLYVIPCRVSWQVLVGSWNFFRHSAKVTTGTCYCRGRKGRRRRIRDAYAELSQELNEVAKDFMQLQGQPVQECSEEKQRLLVFFHLDTSPAQDSEAQVTDFMNHSICNPCPHNPQLEFL